MDTAQGSRERETPGDAPEPVGESREPMMEAPGAGTALTEDTASWNPARGDRSFGYGSGGRPPTGAEADAAAGQGDALEGGQANPAAGPGDPIEGGR